MEDASDHLPACNNQRAVGNVPHARVVILPIYVGFGHRLCGGEGF